MTHKTHHTLRRPTHTHILRWNGNSFCVARLSNEFDFSCLEGKWRKLKVELRIYLESFICWKQLATVKPSNSISFIFLWGRKRKSCFATPDILFIICIRYLFSTFSNFPSQQLFHFSTNNSIHSLLLLLLLLLFPFIYIFE